MFQSTQTVISTTTAADAVTWWDKAAALSTVAVAAFAVIELVRAWLASRRRRREADARVSAIAFSVRRVLRSWLSRDSAPHFVEWKAEIQADFHRIEDWLIAALAEVDASPNVRAALRGALIRYHRALDTFDQLPPTPDGMTVDKGAMMWGGLGTLRGEVQSAADSLTAAIDQRLEEADKAVPHRLREPETEPPDTLEVPEGDD